MNIRNQLINEFKNRVVDCKALLEKDGWGIFYNDFYIGITGYTREKKSQKTRTLRSEQIVSLNIFNQIISDGSVLILPTFEIKTYWTTKRVLYADINVAFECFINESKKYNPQTILWSHIDDEMIQIERGVPGWKLIKKSPKRDNMLLADNIIEEI